MRFVWAEELGVDRGAGRGMGRESTKRKGRKGRAGQGAAFGSSFAGGGRLSTSGRGGLGGGAKLSRAGSEDVVLAAAASHHRRHHHPQTAALRPWLASPRLLVRSACAVGSPRPLPRPSPYRQAARCTPHAAADRRNAVARHKFAAGPSEPALHPTTSPAFVSQPATHLALLLAFGFLPSLSTEAVQLCAPCYTSIAYSLLSAPATLLSV